MKYFTIKELSKSNVANKYGINNNPDKQVEDNLRTLTVSLLDPLRESLGKITINSGYRCETLNNHTEIKGAKTSHHLKGMAADCVFVDNKKAWEYIISSNLKWTQAIYYRKRGFIHLSYDKNNLKCEEIIK